ncbi:Sterol 24-c-methyltransferase [Thalictrum thalictroides]|uniref:Sterol 24-c-methyltransferase n=1 Tax=Thalictrum thalictroides TaxID=46969 RepID=A0A7J6X4E3_THATH|nr:Sterol 24-c-methyltransferase [Thalictrum thalictroides]
MDQSRYEKYHGCYCGDEEGRKANYIDMVNKYYDLVTSFYEFGWGESFHFAHRWKGESLRESIKRHEHFLSCFTTWPATSTSVTSLNNNEYQISRGTELNRIAGVDKTCNFVKVVVCSLPD